AWHEFAPEKLELVFAALPLYCQPTGGRCESAVFRGVGGKLMQGKPQRLRCLVRQTERSALDLQPLAVAGPEGLKLRFDQLAQFDTDRTAGDQQVGGAGKSMHTLLEGVLECREGTRVPGRLLCDGRHHGKLVLGPVG